MIHSQPPELKKNAETILKHAKKKDIKVSI